MAAGDARHAAALWGRVRHPPPAAARLPCLAQRVTLSDTARRQRGCALPRDASDAARPQERGPVPSWRCCSRGVNEKGCLPQLHGSPTHPEP